jgi:pimeloyl-ACP methyl ester carboxylesterase
MAPAADTTQSPSTDKLLEIGFERNCIGEPVFKGDACIYQANRKAVGTVILVHGINGEAANWYHQLKELKKHYHVITFDLPGFGRSSSGNELYSPTNYAKFIHFVAEKYARKPFNLMGHSLGGAIVLRYNEIYPDDVDRLITVDTAGILHRYAFTKSVAYRWLGIFEKITSITGQPFGDFAVGLLQTLEGMPIDIKEALSIPRLRQIILNGNSTPIAGAALVNEDFSEAIHQNKTPTLIVWGAYDMVSPVRTGYILRSNMNNAYLKVLPNSAHSSMSDEPVAFNKLMMSHFQNSKSALSSLYWKHENFSSPEKVATCDYENDKYFEGAYKTIEINNCKNLRMVNVHANSITVNNSSIAITDSIIESDDVGIDADTSEVELTNVIFKAKTAIKSTNSNFDIAGTSFNNSSNNIESVANTTLVFSVSRTSTKSLHKFIKLNAGDVF